MFSVVLRVSDDNAFESGLTLKTDLEVTLFDEGDEDRAELREGTRLLVLSSDLTSVVWFLTEDGREGHFAIEPDPNNAGRSLVGGRPEAEVFDGIVYR